MTTPSQPGVSYAYAPGDWIVLVRSGLIAALPAKTADSTVRAVWEAMNGDAGIATLLPLVSGGFGGGLAAMPSFAVASATSALHVILRGHVSLTATGGSGSATYTGERVTTWTEHILDDGSYSSFTLTCGPLVESSPSLPLIGGAIHARSITGTLVRAGEPSSGSTDAGERAADAATPADERTGSTGSTAHSALPVAEPGSLGAMDPELEAEPSLAVGDVSSTDSSSAAGGAHPEGDDSATINPGLYLTSVPADVADPGIASAVEPLRPLVPRPTATETPAPQEAAPRSGSGSRSGDSGSGTGSAAAGAGQSATAPGEDVGGRGGDAVEEEGTSGPGYDHLWDQTVVRRVEDAAVREADDAPDGSAPASARPGLQTDAGGEKVGGAATDGVDAGSRDGTAPVAAAPEAPAPAPILIDSVPWATARMSEPAADPAVEQAVNQAVDPAPGGFSALPNAGAAVTPAGQAPGDHDGQTIMRSQLPAGAPETPVEPVGPASGDRTTGTGPLVLARLCVVGHANAPTSSTCAICGSALQTETQQVHRPSLGVMRVSTGEVIDLDRSLVVGRQPSVSRVQGKEMPRLVQVQSASGDISRSHVEVRLDGWHVLLCDLKATNGTVLIREGQPPRRLGQGETAFLLDGDIAQLGDDVSLRFEDLP
ncbi:FHA domain-containing protein [Arthrobacter sp. NamB2]|uniref:FHA domain-containing protein n=1 Tax=Arthrobacter sp. NamB2 TaxID=2576035 RepID=UPI0010C97AD7|nr:FHA domain-containing protein [Arthrobacter sp. NamB2]TKV27858.1 FHA domain-containing protein [Arthrobacter sp. NamB2]